MKQATTWVYLRSLRSVIIEYRSLLREPRVYHSNYTHVIEYYAVKFLVVVCASLLRGGLCRIADSNQLFRPIQGIPRCTTLYSKGVPYNNT